MIVRASNYLRALSVSIELSLNEEEKSIKSSLPSWLDEALCQGSIIVVPREDYDCLPDEARAEMEVLKF